MAIIVDQKIVHQLMQIKGEARGTNFKNDGEYILFKKGRQGLKQVEDELKELGFPIDYRRIKNTEFYPVGLRAISLLAIKKVFGWGDEDIEELCRFSVGASLIVRLYMKFFHSIPLMVKIAPRIWREYFTVGRARVTGYNKKEGWAIVRLEDFALHPLYCKCVGAYLENLIKMIVGAKEIHYYEQRCSFVEPDQKLKIHQFLIKWR